ncbi:Nif3-like dinuclear metal center hexameric protein [Bacillus cereus]|nr:Nif3-like dinuclear metal center hexameric protein [Bacillus cereus]
MDLKRFEEIIKQLFTVELLEEFYDDYGFIHASNQSISKIGYATNISPELIEQAARHQVDLIITHHDAWDFIYGLRDECIKKLKEYNISHFYIHGPLDFIEFGTCTSLMNVIEVDHIEQYSFYDNGDKPGIGEFKQPISFSTLVKRMKTNLNEPVRSWKNNNREVKRIGVLTGAGHATNYIQIAVETNCDTYITGEATLYTIQYAQFAGINLIVGSHTFTEIYGVRSLVERLKEFENKVEFIELEEDHFELNY